MAGVLATKFGGATVFGFGISIAALVTLATPVLIHTGFYVFVISRILIGIFEVSTTRSSFEHYFDPWAAHSQDFGEFDFIDLLLIFNSRNHPLGLAACSIFFF